MPAMLDDPTAPLIYRVSGPPPHPIPYGPLPPDIILRQVTLPDRVTIATLVPFSSPHQVPHKLIAYLCELLNREIAKGDTYPHTEPLPLSSFGIYWFGNFGAVMLLGDIQSVEEVAEMERRGVDWAKECLGSFYVKPNYPGRSSHVCNGGFLVTDAARNRGVGRLMGEGYLEWAPRLGYTYSVFNLVYETNVASLRIWDALGFKRIGRVKGCGNLKSYPDQYIDAIIFGRELGDEENEYVSEERFDKIRFYLKTGTYPNGSDRAEKSRLRSAATHYRLVPNPDPNSSVEDRLMLKGKEVISDPHKQYEIARNMHALSHGGINKTTASIAEKYHWVRIKETVSAAIRNCGVCKDGGPKLTYMYANQQRNSKEDSTPTGSRDGRETIVVGEDSPAPMSLDQQHEDAVAGAGVSSNAAQPEEPSFSPPHPIQPPHFSQQQQHQVPMTAMHYQSTNYGDMPVDPQIMHSMHAWQQQVQHHPAQHSPFAPQSTQRHAPADETPQPPQHPLQPSSLAEETMKLGEHTSSHYDRDSYDGGRGYDRLVDERLQQELEAQIQSEAAQEQQRYPRVLRERHE